MLSVQWDKFTIYQIQRWFFEIQNILSKYHLFQVVLILFFANDYGRNCYDNRLRSVLWGSSMLSSKVLHCLLFMLTYTQIYIYFNCQDGKFEWTVGWKDNWILKSMSNVWWSLFIVFNTYCPYIISVIKEDTVFVQIIDLKVIKEGFIG